MLDTDTASFVIRGSSAALDSRLRHTRPRDLCISAITRGELLRGVALRPDSRKLAQLVDQFLAIVASLPWDDAAAASYGRCSASLQRLGTPIGAMDALIAAHALSRKAVLVTHNTLHFSRIADLQVEDWYGAA
jgi:tRNA(fMet)-specific endonuclease VapC